MYNERQNILQIRLIGGKRGVGELCEFRCKRKRKGRGGYTFGSVRVCLYVRSLNYGTFGDLTGIERVIIVPPYGSAITPSIPLPLSPSSRLNPSNVRIFRPKGADGHTIQGDRENWKRRIEREGFYV